jgi:hypothetical protein
MLHESFFFPDNEPSTCEMSFHRCGRRRWYVDNPGIGPTAALIGASVVLVCGEIEVTESRGNGWGWPCVLGSYLRITSGFGFFFFVANHIQTYMLTSTYIYSHLWTHTPYPYEHFREIEFMKLGLMVFEIDEVKGYRVKNIPSLRDTKVSNLCFELWWSTSVTVFLTI